MSKPISGRDFKLKIDRSICKENPLLKRALGKLVIIYIKNANSKSGECKAIYRANCRDYATHRERASEYFFFRAHIMASRIFCESILDS